MKELSKSFPYENKESFWNSNKRTLNWTLQQGFRRKQTQTTGEEPLTNFTDTTKRIIAKRNIPS